MSQRQSNNLSGWKRTKMHEKYLWWNEIVHILPVPMIFVESVILVYALKSDCKVRVHCMKRRKRDQSKNGTNCVDIFQSKNLRFFFIHSQPKGVVVASMFATLLRLNAIACHLCFDQKANIVQFQMLFSFLSFQFSVYLFFNWIEAKTKGRRHFSSKAKPLDSFVDNKINRIEHVSHNLARLTISVEFLYINTTLFTAKLTIFRVK